MSPINRSLLAAAMAFSMATTGGCCPLGGSSTSTSSSPSVTAPAAPPAAPPRFTPQLTAANLPIPVQFVRFGDSTVAHVKGHFTQPTHYVTEDADTSFGGTREVIGRVGTNKGIKLVRVGVTRSQANGQYQGTLGDDYGSISFVFGTLPNRPAPVLLEMEISQPLTASPSICDPVRPLAQNPAATNCPPETVYQPGVTADAAMACGGDEEGQLQMSFRCSESTFLRSRTLTFKVAASSALPTLPPPAPLPPAPGGTAAAPTAPVPPPMPAPVAPPTMPPVMPPTPPPVAVPTIPSMPSGVVVGANPGVIPTAPGLSRGSNGSIDCRSGTHALSGIVLDVQGDDALWVAGDCNMTCTGCMITANDETIDVGGTARLTLVGSTITARSGEALYVAGMAQATVTGSRLIGRPAGYVSGEGQITTTGSTYTGGLQRSGNGRIINQGGNTGVR